MNNNQLNAGKIGLLFLYLELYDDVSPEIRDEFGEFMTNICGEFNRRGIEVIPSPICRVSDEFKTSVATFEEAEVDAVVTVHLAYSPSLECVDALSKTKLPIIVLDTTKDECFNSISLLMYNHGIHGVQDMCNMLLRKQKPFIIEAGHLSSSGLMNRVADHVKGARMANRFRNARVGRIGESFSGMGDFLVSENAIKNKLGFEVVNTPANNIAQFLPDKKEQAVSDEIKKDRLMFDLSWLSPEAHESSVVTGIALRRWIQKECISAFSINFREITRESGLPQMPFLEIGKAMSRGIGYAGEGDVLTAALVGSMADVLGNVTFSEMFCPDWKGDVIFLSHMGEINIALTEEKPQLLEKEWSYTDADPPVYPSACLKKGKATLVNIAPGPDDTFSLIIAPVVMEKDLYKETMGDGVRGWMKPDVPVADFLKKYSEAGGTHHIAIVYGNPVRQLRTFGEIMNWNIIEI